jgi:hypothetical protein
MGMMSRHSFAMPESLGNVNGVSNEMLLRSDTRDMRGEHRDSAPGMLGKIYINTASILWI